MSCLLLHDSTFGNLAKRLYDDHSSEWTVVPGSKCCWIIGSNVAASLCCSICIMPKEGVWLVSTIPNTHTSLLGGRPLWYYNNIENYSSIILEDGLYDNICAYPTKVTTCMPIPHFRTIIHIINVQLFTLGLCLNRDSSIWTTLPCPPSLIDCCINLVLHTSLSHWNISMVALRLALVLHRPL